MKKKLALSKYKFSGKFFLTEQEVRYLRPGPLKFYNIRFKLLV